MHATKNGTSRVLIDCFRTLLLESIRVCKILRCKAAP